MGEMITIKTWYLYMYNVLSNSLPLILMLEGQSLSISLLTIPYADL